MSICIPKEDWTNELEEKYTIYPQICSFNGSQPPPREIYTFYEEDVAIPFSEWKNFYDEFPDSFTSKNISKEATYQGNLRKGQVSIYDEAWSKIQKNHYVFLHLSTATGKTFLGIYLAFKLKKKFVVTTYRTSSLMPQWFDSVKKFSTMNVQHIKSGSTKYDPNADGWLVSPEIMKKMPSNIKKQIGTLILDEAHELVTQSRLDILLTVEPDYLICLTATHDRTDSLESILYLMCGKEEEFVDRFATKEKMNLFKVDTGIKGHHLINPNTGKLDWHELSTSITSQPRRTKIIIDLIKKHPNQRVLLMASFNEQFKRIEQALDKEKITYSRFYDKYNEQKNVSTNVLLGQKLKAGVGFDDVTLDVLIFLDSTKDIRQTEGRIRKDEPIIYDLVDDTNTHRSHWKLRKTWYAKRMGLEECNDDFYTTIDYTKFGKDDIIAKERRSLIMCKLKNNRINNI